MLIWNTLKSTQWGWIVLAMMIGLVSILFRALRWQLMLEPMGHQFPLINAFCSITLGYLINYAIPRAGEVSRCLMLQRTNRVPVEESLGTVVTERIIDVLFLGLLGCIALIVNYSQILGLYEKLSQVEAGKNSNQIYLYIFLAFVTIIIAFFIYMYIQFRERGKFEKIFQFIQRFISGVSSVYKVKNRSLFITYSVLIWICYLLMMYVSFYSMPSLSVLGLKDAVTVQAVGTLGYVLPVPGGIGAFHYFTSKALELSGISVMDGNIYATLVHESQLILFVFTGLISLIILNRNSHAQSTGKNS